MISPLCISTKFKPIFVIHLTSTFTGCFWKIFTCSSIIFGSGHGTAVIGQHGRVQIHVVRIKLQHFDRWQPLTEPKKAKTRRKSVTRTHTRRKKNASRDNRNDRTVACTKPTPIVNVEKGVAGSHPNRDSPHLGSLFSYGMGGASRAPFGRAAAP